MIHENKQYAVVVSKKKKIACEKCDLPLTSCNKICIETAMRRDVKATRVIFKLVGENTK